MSFVFTDELWIFLMVVKACVTCHLALFDVATRELSTASGPGDPDRGQLDLFSKSLTWWGQRGRWSQRPWGRVGFWARAGIRGGYSPGG